VLTIQYGLLAAAATFAGGLLVVAARRWSLANRDYLLAFAAGVLISLALVEILPETAADTPGAHLFLLGGFFFMYLVEQLAIPHHGHQHDAGGAHTAHGLTLMAWAGIVVHSFVDGLAIASGVALDPGLGASVTAGVILHELPEGLLAASLLLAGGASRRRILAMTAVVALATPVGAAISDAALRTVGAAAITNISSAAIAAAGGTFLYVGAADMLHHAHAERHGDLRSVAFFTLGLLIFVVRHWAP
jgi:zinc transporter ZupT